MRSQEIEELKNKIDSSAIHAKQTKLELERQRRLLISMNGVLMSRKLSNDSPQAVSSSEEIVVALRGYVDSLEQTLRDHTESHRLLVATLGSGR